VKSSLARAGGARGATVLLRPVPPLTFNLMEKHKMFHSRIGSYT